MKQLIHSMLAAATLALVPAAFAADSHDHAEKTAGPNGGLVITAVEPHCELFVTPERKVMLTFLGNDGKATAPKEQSLTATGGDRSKPTKFTFVKSGDAFVSEQVLPAGDAIPLILQIKTTPDAKPVTQRIMLNLAKCPTCEYAEYACTCPHGGEEKGHEGHNH